MLSTVLEAPMEKETESKVADSTMRALAVVVIVDFPTSMHAMRGFGFSNHAADGFLEMIAKCGTLMVASERQSEPGRLD